MKDDLIFWAVVIPVAVVLWWFIAGSPDARERRQAIAARRAEAQARIVCHFCHQPGGVTAQVMQKKAGISGGKATGAILTGGFSLVATGLSRKATVTRLTCSNCQMHWDVEG